MPTIGINGTLFLAADALNAQRAGIEITGHNIANVNTIGFARQRVDLRTQTPINTSVGQQGLGVLALAIQQVRSFILDIQVPTNQSTLSYLEEKFDLLNQVQANLGQSLNRLDPLTGSSPTATQGGLQELMDSFFNAFEALATEPASTVLRQQVILTSQALTGKLNTIGASLENLQNQITIQITQNVSDINSTIAEIAYLNSQIASVEVGGANHANDLRDRRQQLIEDLSKRINISTREESDRTVTIRLGASSGPLLVSGVFSGNTASASTIKLAVSGAASSLNIRSWTGGEAEIAGNLDVVTPQPTGGTLAAEIEAVATTIGDAGAGLIRDYNRIAAALASLVNTQHAAGFTLEGSPAYATAGNPTFFDDDAVNGNPLGAVTARNIQLNSFVAGDVSRIAASSIIAEPNNGSNAASLAALRSNTTDPSLGGLTISGYYITSLTSLGSNIHDTDSRASTQKLVVQQLTQQRDSVMGVSLDEETTNLLRFQHAFEANARVISTVDIMMQTILNLGR